MARAAVLGRVTWRVGSVEEVRAESTTARTLVMHVPGWPGHLAGQHVDVRLTAPDGYTAARSYSLASAPDGERVELTVEAVPDGEVSTYLTESAAAGDPLEIRGPLGGWFVWRPSQHEPVQLVAGGSGLVPLMAMLRTHAATGTTAPMRLLYSVREPGSVLFRPELDRLARDGVRTANGSDVVLAYTRSAPPGWPRPPGRIEAKLIAHVTLGAHLTPTCYVCGPTPFVEAASDLLVGAGHDPSRIRTERFGPTGGSR
jgi:ferredoxin-NADP reductase